MSLSKNSESEVWRRNLLDRFRREFYYDPAKLVKFDITVGGANMELDVFSNNEMIGFKTYKTFEDKLSKQLAQVDTEASVEVTSLTGGVFNFMHDYNPREYSQEDYPVEPGDEQWKSQKPLGRKTVVQYDKAKYTKMFDTEGFVNVIDEIV